MARNDLNALFGQRLARGRHARAGAKRTLLLRCLAAAIAGTAAVLLIFPLR